MRIFITVMASAVMLASCAEPVGSTNKSELLQVTYLKVAEGSSPSELEAVIKKHWYAMDERGVQRGIFTSYALYECRPAETCDFAMIVGYPQARGYDDEETQKVFQEIQAQHRTANPDYADQSRVLNFAGSLSVIQTD